MQEINSSEDLRNFIEFTTGMEESEQQIDEQQIESRWDMYITEIEGNKALVLVDMALSGIAPLMEYNILFGLQIGILNPSEDGFYTAEEQPKLYEIEDRAVDIFTKEAPCRFVATVTSGGSRIMYFYAKNDNFLAALVGKIAAEYGEYRFDYMMEKDGPWNFYYNALLPGVLEQQLMDNRRIHDALEAQGFDLKKERPTCHWFYFENGAKRRQCAVRLMAWGYEILDDNFYDEDVVQAPFGLKAACMQDMQLDTLFQKTYASSELAEEYEGIYDGWQLMDDGDHDAE